MSGICPHCGWKLGPSEPLSVGPLEIDNQALHVSWRGIPVKLTPTERCIVSALALANGRALSHEAIVGAGGFEDIEHPVNQVRVYAYRIKTRFRAIDPAFNALKTEWGFGLRWAA